MIKRFGICGRKHPGKGRLGKENKGTCLMLLTKYYLAAGEFEKALNAANTLINNCGYELMEEPFWYI